MWQDWVLFMGNSFQGFEETREAVTDKLIQKIVQVAYD